MGDADLILVALFTAWRDDIDSEPFPTIQALTVQKGHPAK